MNYFRKQTNNNTPRHQYVYENCGDITLTDLFITIHDMKVKDLVLTFTTLWATSTDDKMIIVFSFPVRNPLFRLILLSVCLAAYQDMRIIRFISNLLGFSHTDKV